MAEKKKSFNIADYMKPWHVSNLDTAAPVIELIDIDLIDSNELNFYELSGLQSLANSIALGGLQQPLVVITSPDDPSRVKVISGHRRKAAIKLLVDDSNEPRPELRQIPCIRQKYSSLTIAELQLIFGNSENRVLTSVEIMHQAERTEMLLYKLKEEEGYEFPGRMRDYVAEACNVSASRLARLNVIRERLEPEFMEAFESGKLSEDAAYHVAKDMTPEMQGLVIEARTTGKSPCGLDIPANVVDNIAKSLTHLEEGLPEDCPSGDECTAKHGMQRRIARFKNSWDSGCHSCCQKCWSHDRCANACAVCKEQNKKEAEKREAQRKRDEKAHEKETQKLKMQNKAFAERLVALAPDPESRKKLSGISWQFQKDFFDKALAGEYTGYGYCRPDSITGIRLADAFGVSLDYIYGRSMDPHGGGSITWTPVEEDIPPVGEWVFGICPDIDPPVVTTKIVEKKGETQWLGGQRITHWCTLSALPLPEGETL